MKRRSTATRTREMHELRRLVNALHRSRWLALVVMALIMLRQLRKW